MLDVIVKSSVNTDCIAGSMVTWFERKDMLKRYFKVPSAFKISEYQVFIATSLVGEVIHDLYLLNILVAPRRKKHSTSTYILLLRLLT